jgi:hypothetical protein
MKGTSGKFSLIHKKNCITQDGGYLTNRANVSLSRKALIPGYDNVGNWHLVPTDSWKCIDCKENLYQS